MGYNSSVKKALVVSAFVLVFLTPATSFAAGLAGPLVPNSSAAETKGTDYTLCDLVTLANNIINFAVAFSVIVATLMFAYGGVLYVTGAAGGEAQIKKAHKVLLNAFIGILLILLAWLIVNIVLSVLTNQSVSSWTGWLSNCAANPSSSTVTTAAPSGLSTGP